MIIFFLGLCVRFSIRQRHITKLTSFRSPCKYNGNLQRENSCCNSPSIHVIYLIYEEEIKPNILLSFAPNMPQILEKYLRLQMVQRIQIIQIDQKHLRLQMLSMLKILQLGLQAICNPIISSNASNAAKLQVLQKLQIHLRLKYLTMLRIRQCSKMP